MFKFNLFNPKEYLMVNEAGVQQYVLDAAVQKRMENGLVLYVDESRDAPDYYVPDILQFFGKMSYGKLPGIKLIQSLFRIHKSYKEKLNFLDVAWGIMTLGKLPTISFMSNVAKDWYEDLTNVARIATIFVVGLILASPIVAGLG